MDIGGTHVVVLAAVMGMVVAGMVMAAVRMPMRVIILEDQRADQVDRKTDAGDQQRVAVSDRRRRDDARDGFHRHHQRGDAQDDGAGKSGEVAELAGAEGETAAAGMAPRQPIGPRRQAQRPDMGRHVRAIGQQGHGVVQKTAGDLHHHEDRGDDGGPLRTHLRAGMARAQEDMIARPDAVFVAGWRRVLSVVTGERVIVRMQGVVVRHGRQFSAAAGKNR